MSSSSKRKVTLEKSSSDNGDKSKPSVFDRLGPGLSSDVESRDVCREFLKRGSCGFGKSCKYSHTMPKSDKSSDDYHKSSRSKHDDTKNDSEKTSGTKNRRDSKDAKLKSTIGVVSKHSTEGGDGIWPETSSGSRNEEHKYDSKSHPSSRQKDTRESPSKSVVRSKDSKLDDDSASKSKKKKKRNESSVSPDAHKRHHRRQSGDSDVPSDKQPRDSVKPQKSPGISESPRVSDKAKSKDSVPSRLQKLAMESDIKLAENNPSKKARKGSPGREYGDQSATTSGTSGTKKNDIVSPVKSRDTKSKVSKSKDDVSPSRDKESRNRTPSKEQKKDRDASPSRAKPKGTDSKVTHGAKDASAKVQKHGTKRTRKDSSSSSSSGTSSSSDSSSGSSSSGSSSSSSSSSSAASLPKHGKKTVKREHANASSDRKKDDHSKRHQNSDRTTETDDRLGHGGIEAKAETSSRNRDSINHKQTDTSKSDDRDRRRKDQVSPQTDASRRRDNVRDDDRWHSDSLGDTSKRLDREKTVRDNLDDRRRTNDLSPRSQKPLKDDRDSDRRRRESPSERYLSKPSSGRYDREEQHDAALVHDIPVYEQRLADVPGPSEHLDDRDSRQTPRSDREHLGDRYHNEYDREAADRDFESRDRGFDRHTADVGDRNRDKEYAADRHRRGDAVEDARRDRTSRRGQWETERDTGDYPGRRGVGTRQEPRGHSDKYESSRKRNDYAAEVDSSRSPVGLRRQQRDISPNQSAMYDRDIDKDRDRSRQGRDGMREEDRRSTRPDMERSRDERGDRDRDRGGDHDRGRMELDRGHRDRDRGTERDREPADRGRDKDHGEQEWDYSRNRNSRGMSKDVKPDSSDTVKPGGRSDRRSDNYYRDSKRRRSPSHDVDEAWDRHRADKKRSRYEDDESVDRDRRGGDGPQGKLAGETGRNKADDKRDILPKETELSALPPYVTEERSRRSQSRGSLGSRTSQRDPRIDPRLDLRNDYRFEPHHEFRTGEFRDMLEPRGVYREIDRLRDRPVGSLPPFDREPFPDRDMGYFRGEPRGVGGLGPGYDRSGRIEIDVTRPPPPIPFRGHGYEQDRLVGREPVETSRDYEWHSSRGYRGQGRPPNWDRPEGPSRDEMGSRYGGVSRGADGPLDHRTVPGPLPPPASREEFRGRENISVPPPVALPPRAESSRPKTEDQTALSTPAPIADPVVAESPQAGVIAPEPESDSKANIADDIGYDDISDDELDDLITGAEEEREEKQPEKTAVVDILDIKWESLMQQDGQKSLAMQRGSALKRFSAHSIFSQIGVSVAFAGEALVQKLKHVCQQQMNEEIASAEEPESAGKEEESAKVVEDIVKTEPSVKMEPVESDEVQPETVCSAKVEDTPKEAVPPPIPKNFELLCPLAEFHASAVRRARERAELVANIGSYRRALCARRDLAVRRALCKVDKDEVGLYPPQEVDHDIYKLSLQLYCQDRSPLERKLSLAPTSASQGLTVAAVR